ncbi:MAG: hypothetical protein Q9208_000757 [Pyrenodesmia sp. 3 TL-2023]
MSDHVHAQRRRERGDRGRTHRTLQDRISGRRMQARGSSSAATNKSGQEYEARRPQIGEQMRRNQLWLDPQLEKQRREYEARRAEFEAQSERSRQCRQEELLARNQRVYEAQRPLIEEHLEQAQLWLDPELEVQA